MVRQNIYILFGFMILLYLIDFFFGFPIVIHYFIGLLAILSVILSFKEASNIFKILGVLFLVSGFGLYIYNHGDLYKLPLSMTSNLNIIALLLVLPFIQSLLHVGGYTIHLYQLLQSRAHHLGELYRRSIFSSFTLATFINVSTLYLSHSVMSKALAKLPEKMRVPLISKTILRGVVIALALSPMEIIVAITVDITEINYIIYLPWLLLVAALVLSIESLNSWRYRKYPLSDEVMHDEQPTTKSKPNVQIGMLLLLLSSFIVCVYFAGNWFNISFLMALTVVIVPFSFVWSCFLRRVRQYTQHSFKEWKDNANGMQNFIVLFIPLGFFTTTINQTVFLEYLRLPFMNLVEYPLLVMLLIQLAFLIMSFIGLHAVATIGIFAEILPPVLEFIHPLSLGVVLITGAMSTATIAPFGMMLNIVASLTKQSPYEITKYNLLFAFMFCAIGTLVGFIILYL